MVVVEVGESLMAVSSRWRKEGWRFSSVLPGSLRRYNLLLITGQFIEIIRANAPLVGGLEALAVDAPDRKFERVLLSVRDDIASGLTFHEALERQPGFFPRFYTDMVKIGEESGKLYECLCEIEDELFRSLEFRDAFRHYLQYVLGVTLFQVILLVFILVWVLPRFHDLFDALGGNLPLGLSSLLRLGIFLSQWELWLVILLLAAGIPIARRFVRRQLEKDGEFGRVWGRICLSLPLARTILVKQGLSHVASVLEKLLMCGMPLNRALESAASVHVNPVYRAALTRIKEGIERGESLKEAMERERNILPESFRGLVALGESSGLLPEALGRIVFFYRREALADARVLLDIAAPLMLCVTGLLAAWVCFPIYMVIFSLSQIPVS